MGQNIKGKWSKTILKDQIIFNIIFSPEVLCDYDGNALPHLYSTPPAKVRHPVYGIGTFQSINPSGQYCYDFGLGYVIKVFNQPQGPQGPAFY